MVSIKQIAHLMTITTMICHVYFNFLGNDINKEFTDTWKVLVYDQACRDIISPLMNIGALRQKGVTLHMMVRNLVWVPLILRTL